MVSCSKPQNAYLFVLSFFLLENSRNHDFMSLFLFSTDSSKLTTSMASSCS